MIGSIIKIVRKEKGLTQKELGNLLNLADTTISAYEKEKISPDFETIMKILEICGYDFKIVNPQKESFDLNYFVNKFDL